MPLIRPVSDLRNNFTDISKKIHEVSEPIFLTKNGYGDMVVMSIETYEKMKINQEIYLRLKEAELESLKIDLRYTHEEVISDLNNVLQVKVGAKDV